MKNFLIIMLFSISLAACDLTPPKNAGTHPVIHHPPKDPTIATPDQVQDQRAESQIAEDQHGDDYPTSISDLIQPEQ